MPISSPPSTLPYSALFIPYFLLVGYRCGGQGTLMNRTRGTLERNEAGRRSVAHWAREFPNGLSDVRSHASHSARTPTRAHCSTAHSLRTHSLPAVHSYSCVRQVRRRVETAQRELDANASLAAAIEATLPLSAEGGGCARDCARQGGAHRATARAAEQLCSAMHA